MAAIAPAAPAVTDAPAFGSAKWWLLELGNRLTRRRPSVLEYEAYYNGEHKLEYATEKFRKAFGNLFGTLADNWCEVIVDATEERLNVEGFRFGDSPDADDDAWEIWQRNNLDADSQLAHLDMLVAGAGYALVWGKGDDNPLITVESPQQCIVAHAAGSRREREAGLKQWRGDDGYLYGFVYQRDTVTRFRSASKPSGSGNTADDAPIMGTDETRNPAFWVPFEGDGDNTELHNPMGRVSLVPLYNRPRSIRSHGVSELRVAKPLQNAVNKLLSDLLLSSEYASFRQRWATGLTLDRDEEGNTKPPPFKHGPGNIWIDEGSEIPGETGARFGEFQAAELTNVIAAIDLVVSHLASQSRTPPHYLNTSADRLSGESIKSSETGLVSKCKRKMRPTGEGWEEVERLGFLVKGDKAKGNEARAETVWRDPESRTEAEHVDATLKKKDLGVPLAQLWEDLGYSPPQIARFAAMRAQEQLEAALNPPPAPVVVNTAPAGPDTNGNRPPAPGGGDQGGAPPAQ